MKNSQGPIFVLGLLAFLAAPAAAQYDNSPKPGLVAPECIWAAATGGGTWVTELQITAYQPSTSVNLVYRSAGGSRSVHDVWTSSSSGSFQSVKFTNILSALQSLDPSFTYYGTVGSLEINTQDADHTIQAQTRTINGNYGKTFQALAYCDANTANVGRNMMIMNLTQNAAYRTFVGFFNATEGGWPLTAEFVIVDGGDNQLGSTFSKSFTPWKFMSFNPFVEAGVGSEAYDNCWLWINVTASGHSGAGSWGLMGFGSSANNATNDSASHLAVHAWY